MGTKTKCKVYARDALSNLGQYLEQVRKLGTKKLFECKISLDGLEKAIHLLDKNDREIIEKFWGLTGGTNHSKKMKLGNRRDLAYMQMMRKALLSFAQLTKLDFVIMYDESIKDLINYIMPKINKDGMEDISDFECVKYLVAFFVLIENGPKMSFEEDLMTVETKIDKSCYMDEYEALNELGMELKEFPEHSISFGLVKSVFDMMDVKDTIAVKQNFGIKFDDLVRPSEIENINTFAQIRAFKERIFQYGAWEVTCNLVLGRDVALQEFAKKFNMLRKDWSRISEFKTSQKTLQTSTETRTLDVYTIGELEFTDPYEIMFLYLERDFIECKVCA